MKKRFPIVLRNFVGPLYTWYMAGCSRRIAADLPARLRDALARVSPEAQQASECPVFVLSAGWRSGSTLLQRMIMEHNDNIMIWGEPYDHANICESMANQFRCFTAEWPLQRVFLSTRRATLTKLSDDWVASLYPEVDCLLNAHRRFFDVLFGEEARRVGRQQWGLKEVRLTIDHAAYLRALYPHCKLLLLYRNPQDAYRSYRGWGGAGWYRHWPDRPVPTAHAFGRNWAEMTRGFIDRHADVHGLLVKYEELDDPAAVKRIEDYLGWPVPRSSELRKIGSVEEGSREKRGPPLLERMLLDMATGRTLKDAGY